MQHTTQCKWERTTSEECEYRDTHHYCPHPEHACDCKGQPKFKVGDKVRKVKGYAWEGKIVMAGNIEGTGIRYVVQQNELFVTDIDRVDKKRVVAGGALHIFAEEQLELYAQD